MTSLKKQLDPIHRVQLLLKRVNTRISRIPITTCDFTGGSGPPVTPLESPML